MGTGENLKVEPPCHAPSEGRSRDIRYIHLNRVNHKDISVVDCLIDPTTRHHSSCSLINNAEFTPTSVSLPNAKLTKVDRQRALRWMSKRQETSAAASNILKISPKRPMQLFIVSYLLKLQLNVNLKVQILKKKKKKSQKNFKNSQNHSLSISEKRQRMRPSGGSRNLKNINKRVTCWWPQRRPLAERRRW